MIYEFRTYTLQPRTLPKVLELFGEALPKRLEYSALAAFWYTEIGPLNQIVHVWPYADAAERDRIRAQAVADGNWPPKIGGYLVDMKSEIFKPLAFSPALEPSENGPYYETRSYVIKPGSAPAMAERWQEYLPGRLELSPLTGVFTSDVGELNQWVHIWAYNSLDQRAEVRAKALKGGIWPPPGDSPVVSQENKIMLPAPFSPLK